MHEVSLLQEKNDSLERFFSFGNKLKDLRKGKGRNQAQMAAVLGCSPTNYWKYEKGIRELPLKFLRNLIQSEGMDAVAWLLSDSSEELTAQGYGGQAHGGAIEDLASALKTIGEANKGLNDKIAILEGRTTPIAWDQALEAVLDGLPDDQARRVVRGVVEKMMAGEEVESVQEGPASASGE